MTSPTLRDRDALPGIQISLIGASREDITAEQVGLFLFDFAVAFELFRGFVESEGAQRLTNWDLYRGHRRVAPVERLTIERIRMESPIIVVATTVVMRVGGAAAIWAITQALERIYMLPLNRRKAKLEIRKLELEIHKLENEADDDATQKLRSRSVTERAKMLPARGRGEPSVSREHLNLARTTMLDEVVHGRTDDHRQDRHGDGTREVLETARRRLLRNSIQVEQLEIEFRDNLQPPAA